MSTHTGSILGIDIGGSGIKGAPVDVATGELTSDRLRIPTPKKATPKACAAVVAEIVDHFSDQIGDNPVGVAIPGPVVRNVVKYMANLDPSWVGVNADDLFSDKLGRKVELVNDADAAGLAEVRWGSAKGVRGLVVVTPLGTGIGSALLWNGELIPNSELGHIEIDGVDAELRASSSAKAREKLNFKRWARRLTRYYQELEKLLRPDLIVIGGGVSKQHEKFIPLIDIETPITVATLFNQAGIVGSAANAATGLDFAPATRAAEPTDVATWDDVH